MTLSKFYKSFLIRAALASAVMLILSFIYFLRFGFDIIIATIYLIIFFGGNWYIWKMVKIQAKYKITWKKFSSTDKYVVVISGLFEFIMTAVSLYIFGTVLGWISFLIWVLSSAYLIYVTRKIKKKYYGKYLKHS
jgi:hypothetical protein